ncbi:MAG: transglycosylase SLT domain-containing protein, partial [Terriglobales bacterium]
LDAAAAVDQRLLVTSERAQALEIQLELSRTQHIQAALQAPLDALAREFPASRWHERALHEAGDEALVDADLNATLEQFDRLRLAFPQSAYAPGAAWQAAWAAYRLGRADAPLRLQHYLEAYPQGQEATDALYWRGEWASAHHQPALALACFRTTARRFPGTYFGAQARLRAVASPAASPAGVLPAWLKLFQADPPAPLATSLPARFAPEVARANALAQVGLAAPAATILSGVLRQQPRGAPSLRLARQLAALDAGRGAWHQGLEAMLRAVPNYLELAPAQLRRSDWRLLFPIPYAADIRVSAVHFGLDRSLLLGVMRQESSFNPNDLSPARARGLMQLELGTASGPFRHLPPAWKALAGSGPLRSSDLFNPGLNLALGAAVLQRLLQQYPEPAYALAGYNAGESRARQWQQAYAGLETNTFIESIPFSQTRLYVQAVLRNQTHYLRIYGR